LATCTLVAADAGVPAGGHDGRPLGVRYPLDLSATGEEGCDLKQQAAALVLASRWCGQVECCQVVHGCLPSGVSRVRSGRGVQELLTHLPRLLAAVAIEQVEVAVLSGKPQRKCQPGIGFGARHMAVVPDMLEGALAAVARYA